MEKEAMTEIEAFADWARAKLGVGKVDASQYSPLALAYMGDCVYELLIRTKLVSMANAPVNRLNQKGSELAMAKTQARLVALIWDALSEEEQRLVSRGKNAKVGMVPKSCTPREYHLATGLECLVGYLYLSGQYMRAVELTCMGWERLAGNPDEAAAEGE